MKKWKVALIGCGMIADTIYLPEMKRLPNAELVAVCDILPERAEQYARKYGVPHWYVGIDALLEGCDFDILMHTTSIHAHHEINMKALRAGKHLYSQKPVGLTVEEVSQQIEAAKEAGVKYAASPIHMLRPDMLSVKRMIEEGTIGTISMVRCSVSHGGPEYFQYRDADPSWFFEPGAGALYDMGIHGLTMVTGLLGPAKRVSCMAAISQPRRTVRSGALDGNIIHSDKVPDNYLISLDWGDGVIGIVDAGFCQKASTVNCLEVYGSLGTITILGQLRIGDGEGIRVYLDAPERGVRGWMEPLPQSQPPAPFFQTQCLVDLIDAIENDTETSLRPEHARHVAEILTTIPRAIEEKRTLDLSTVF